MVQLPGNARNWTLAAGPLLVLCYCVINSIKVVVEGALIQDLTPEFLAFHVFLVAQLFFLGACRDVRALVGSVRRAWAPMLVFNVTTAVSWLAVLYALTVFEPVVANSIIIGLVPSISIVMSLRLQGTRVVRWELIAALGVLGSLVYLSTVAWSGSSAIGDISTAGFLFGLLMCLLTAVAVVGNTFCTKRLSASGMSVSQMMACRFVLLIVLTYVLLLTRDSFAPYTAANIGTVLAISALGVIVSLYLLQQGIVRTEPNTVSLLFGTNLLITYAVQLFDPRLEQSWATLTGVLLLTVSMVAGVWARMRDSAGEAGVDTAPAATDGNAPATTGTGPEQSKTPATLPERAHDA